MLFDLQIFSGGVYSPSATSRTISYLFPIVFGIKLIHFFDFFDDKEERCSRKFDRLLCCFDPLSITPFDSAKNAKCFEKCNVLATESVNSAPFKRGETEVQIFWQGKAQIKLFANTKVHIFGKEKCKTHRQF